MRWLKQIIRSYRAKHCCHDFKNLEFLEKCNGGESIYGGDIIVGYTRKVCVKCGSAKLVASFIAYDASGRIAYKSIR